MKHWRQAAVWFAVVSGVVALGAWFYRPVEAINPNRIYRIGYGRDAPFHYQGPDGKPAGMAVELVREAARRSGVRLEWVEGAGIGETCGDFWVLMTRKPERLRSLHITEPYLLTHSCLVVAAESAYQQQKDLLGARISYQDLQIHWLALSNAVPRCLPVPANSALGALEELMLGRVDAAYVDGFSALAAMRDGRVKRPMRIIPTPESGRHLGIASTWAEAHVADAMRRAMRSMAEDGSLQAITERWGFFPNLSTDLIESAELARRRARWLVVGVLVLSGLLVCTVVLAVRSGRQARQLKVAQADLLRHREGLEELVRSRTAELERFFDVTVDLLCIADRLGRFVRLNRAWERTLGYSRDELMKGVFLDYVHPEDVPETLETMRRLSGQGEVAGFLNRYRCKDGSYRWLEWRAAPFGELIYGAARDVTERRLTEEVLRRSEARLVMATEAAQIGIWDWDVVKNELLWDDSMYRLYGVRKEDFAGAYEAWIRCVHPDDAKRVGQEIEAALRGEQEYAPEFRILRPDGSVHHIQAASRTFRDGSGTPVRMIGTNLDVTERKRSEERQVALNHLKERLLGGGSLEEKLKVITDGLVLIFHGDTARIWVVQEGDYCGKGCAQDESGSGAEGCGEKARCLHLRASSGRYTRLDGEYRRVPSGRGKIGRLISGDETKLFIPDVAQSAEIHDPEWARSLGLVSFAGFRLVSRRGEPMGVMALFTRTRILPDEEKLLEDMAHTASQVLLEGLALAEVKTLSGLLPICSWCKKVRDDRGYWTQIEAYITRRSNAAFSHGICPDCMSRLEREPAEGA